MNLFKELQEEFQSTLRVLLEKIDVWLMNNRDFSRFKNRERQEITIATIFGPIMTKYRIYKDELADIWVML